MKRLFAGFALSALSFGAFSADHFAQRFALDLNGNAAYYAASVPQAVYAASLRRDLGDVRVYNGAGEPVPYSLDMPKAVAPPPPQRRAVQWFALPVADTGTHDVPLGVSIASDGSLRATTGAPARAERSGDLVDMGRIDGYADALLVHLDNDAYQGRVRVEASDDLRVWRPVTATQLLKVSHDGNTISQERIELDGLRERYVRLDWLDNAPQIASADVEIRATDPRATERANAARQWRDAIHVRAGRVAGEYLFETDGAYPVDRLRFELPQPNTVARATIFSRANAQAPWRVVDEGTLFRLRGSSGEQINTPFDLPVDTDHEWRIAVDMRNGGWGDGQPGIAVGWRPAVLTFVARGTPPFVLAVGNASLRSAGLSRSELIVGDDVVVGAATVGGGLPVSAEDAFAARADSDAGTSRKYVLWGSLVLAVGALAGLAWRVAKGVSTS